LLVANSVAGANTVSFQLADDTTLVGAISNANVVLSQEPTLLYADLVTPAVSGTFPELRTWIFALNFIQFKIPLQGGRKYFCAFQGGGSCILLTDSEVS